MVASRAMTDSAALMRSSRPASGSRNSGRTRGPSTSSSPIGGTASRKTEPHQKRSSSTPPSTGPTAPPAEKAAIQTPMAVERSRGSRNMLKIRERVEGARVAPAISSAARLTISISALVEKAASKETPPKAAAPMSRSLRRPIRSPSVPMVISDPATRKP